MINIFNSLKFRKRKKELREVLQELINLIIVVQTPEKQDLHVVKTADNTTLAYASSFQKLLNKVQIFKEQPEKDVELIAAYALYDSISFLYSAKYDDALASIKKVLTITSEIDNELNMEAKYMHYLATIMLTHVMGQEIFETLEIKYKQEKIIQQEIEKKIEAAEKLLDGFNSSKYESLGEEKIKEAKLRVLENQKKLLTEYMEIEAEINGTFIPLEFVEILIDLEGNLKFIEEEMLESGLLVKENAGDKDVFYPIGHIPNLIYLYLQGQRAKSLFYRKEYLEFNLLVEQVYHHTNYTNWAQPLLVLKNGNREFALSKIQNYSNLETYNNFIDKLVFEKQISEYGNTLIIRNKKEDEDVQYYVKEVD